MRGVSHRLDDGAEVGQVRRPDAVLVPVIYEYPAGVLPEERPTIERFEDQVVPYVQKHGSRIGESAIQGDLDAEEVIRRYNHFVNGMPHLREFNLKLLISSLKRWEARNRQ